MHPKKYEYIAFMSYCRADKEIVEKIHEELESYTIPKEFRTEEFKSGKLGKIFLDIYELGASDNVNDDIQKKLDASKHLIIMCSPDAAKSEYVNAEIRYFQEHRKDGKVLVYLLRGEPNAKSRNKPEELELLPKVLRNKKDMQSDLGIEHVGYSGADLRDLDERSKKWKQKFNLVERTLYLTVKEVENIRMIAALLSLRSIDQLINREESRKRIRLIQKVSVTLVIVFLALFGQYQYQKTKTFLFAESKATLDKAREAFDSKDWKKAFLLFKKSFQLKPSLEAKIGLKLSSEKIIPEVAAFDNNFGKITKLLFLDDNKTLVMGGENGTITFLDIYSGKIVKKIVQKDVQKGTITDLKLTQDGKFILSTSDMYQYPNSNTLKTNSGIVKICNIATSQCKIISKGDKASQVFPIDNDTKVVYTQYTSDDKGNGYEGIFVWDRKLQKISTKILVGRGGYHNQVFIDTDTVATLFYDKLLLYDLNTGKLKQKIDFEKNIDSAIPIGVSKLLVYSAKSVGIFDTNKKDLRIFPKSADSYILSADILKTKPFVIGGTQSGKVYIWSLKGHFIGSMRTNSAKINTIATTNDGNVAAIAGNDNRLSLYDIKNLKLRSFKPAIKLPKEKNLLIYAVSPNNKYMAYGHFLIDLDSNKTIQKNIFTQQQFPLKVRFDPTSKKIVYEILGKKKHEIIAMDIENKISWRYFFEDPVTLNDIAIAPFDMNVAIATNKSIHILNKKNGSKKLPFEAAEAIKSFEFGYKGKRLFIMTEHFLYDYDLSSNSLSQQWYFGMNFMQNIFIHNISDISEKTLLFDISLFKSNYNQIKSISKSLGKNISTLEMVSLSLNSVFKHSKLYNTYFQNPPFNYTKFLAQSPDGKILVALNKGYTVLIDPNNQQKPFFINIHNESNILSGTIGSSIFAVANFSKIYLYNKHNGFYILSLSDYYDHPILSSKGDLFDWIFSNTFKSSIDLDTKKIIDQTIFIPFTLSNENRSLIKKSALLATERAKVKNKFQTLNKNLSNSLQ